MCSVTEILNAYPKKHGITIEELADSIGYENPSTLGRHINPNDFSRPFPLKKLIPLIKACNNDFTVLDHIEKNLGRVAFEIPKRTGSISLKNIGTLADKSGKALSTMAEALEDGIIDAGERKELQKVLIELAQRVNTILGKLSE